MRSGQERPREGLLGNASDRDPARPPFVWAVGGGKGGVGKSVVTSSLAIALARRGHRCVLVDADLGGANLHTILGIGHPRRTLTHFLEGEVPSLDDVRCPGPVPNLSLISGAQALLETANPKHSRKVKLLRHVHRLDADHVFLDLGAGSAFNVLDFFLAASQGVLVVVPEPTSIENAYHFLKAAFFRTLRQTAKRGSVRETIVKVLEQHMLRRLRSPRELIAAIGELDPEAGSLLAERVRRFRPALVVNQARTLEHQRIGRDIAIACRDYLGTEITPLGALARDECVRVAVSEKTPVLERFPGSPFSRDLQAVAESLLAPRPSGPPGSADEVECSFRDGRARFGRDPLAVTGLRDDEEVADSAYERVERSVDRLVEPPPAAAPSPPPARPSLPPPDLEAPGAYLRRCRERLGLGIAELAKRTRILCLAAIEAERFEAVPPEPFIRGFVRTYAEILGVPQPDAVAAAFVARHRLARARQRRSR